METVPLRCACGAVTGEIADAHRVYRVVCHCSGCRAYARFLGREDSMLDGNGGTDVYQLTPSQLTLRAPDPVRCVRLTPRGALRWYTACCRTPVGNTLARPNVPFLGLPHPFIDAGAVGDTRSDAVAPVRFRIHGGQVGNPPGVHRTGPLSLIGTALVRGIADMVAGRHAPSPFFVDGEPSVTPELLDGPAREAIGLPA